MGNLKGHMSDEQSGFFIAVLHAIVDPVKKLN